MEEINSRNDFYRLDWVINTKLSISPLKEKSRKSQFLSDFLKNIYVGSQAISLHKQYEKWQYLELWSIVRGMISFFYYKEDVNAWTSTKL